MKCDYIKKRAEASNTTKKGDLYDSAKKLIEKYQEVIKPDEDGETILSVLKNIRHELRMGDRSE